MGAETKVMTLEWLKVVTLGFELLSNAKVREFGKKDNLVIFTGRGLFLTSYVWYCRMRSIN